MQITMSTNLVRETIERLLSALEKLKTGGMNFIDSNSRLYHLESGQ